MPRRPLWSKLFAIPGRTGSRSMGVAWILIGLLGSIGPGPAALAVTDLGTTLGLRTEQPSEVPVPPVVKPDEQAPQGAAVPSPQHFDYSSNLVSEVFGAQLFTGAFARAGATRFNPDYVIGVGDQVQVRLWGSFEADALFTVDPQGNIFLPQVGPVKVLGVRNQEIQKTVEDAVRRVFRTNVYSYASLAAAQPVRVFVGGNVHRPGLYNGTSMDSLLHFLDQAGGIDPERGTFLAIEVKRGNQIRARVNLYDFLLEGRMPLVQLADGDVIFVPPRQNTAVASGLVANAKRFEFSRSKFSASDLLKLAKPHPHATHVRVVRNTGTLRNVEYFPLEKIGNLSLENGDELQVTADKRPGTITVRVEGEHQSAQEYVLPYGARLGEVMSRIQLSERSDDQNVQLYRESVRERQKLMLNSALKSLETSVLTARSSTNEESRLRRDEADLILQWVDRARKIEPSGQVVIAQDANRFDLLLENGDIIRIPTRDGLVLVSGEVLFPNAIAYDPSLRIQDYINRAGGYSQTANTSRIIVALRDGSFQEVSPSSGGSNAARRGPPGRSVTSASAPPVAASERGGSAISPGAEILVLPRIQTKSIEVTRGLTQILFQIAIIAKTVLDL